MEGAAFTEYGTRLSPEVAAAIPTAVEAVLRLVGASDELCARARALASNGATVPLASLLGR